MALPILSVAAIQAALDLKEIPLEIPEWGGSVTVSAITVEERDELLSTCSTDGKLDGQKMMRKVVELGLREPKLTADIIAKKNFRIIDRIGNEILELSGMKEKSAIKADVTFRQES